MLLASVSVCVHVRTLGFVYLLLVLMLLCERVYVCFGVCVLLSLFLPALSDALQFHLRSLCCFCSVCNTCAQTLSLLTHTHTLCLTFLWTHKHRYCNQDIQLAKY